MEYKIIEWHTVTPPQIVGGKYLMQDIELKTEDENNVECIEGIIIRLELTDTPEEMEKKREAGLNEFRKQKK